MVPKSLEIGDLVWAKMKGYPYWPGKISNPPADSKAKKGQHYVFFFGSENYAWISDENIEIHDQKLVEKHTKNQKRFLGGYLNAVEEIVSASKSTSKQVEDNGKTLEESVIKVSNNVSSSNKRKFSIDKKKRTPDKGYNEKRKKVSIAKSYLKKDPRRISSIFNRSSGSPKSPRKDDDYSELTRNLPPNNADSDESMASCEFDMKFEPSIGHHSEPIEEFSKSNKVDPTSKKIGFLGLGNMGKNIVKNLVETGHKVMVWNRSSKKYGECPNVDVADSVADVINACDITFSCMTDEEVAKNIVSEEIRDGFGVSHPNMSDGEKKGYVELTSLDPGTSEHISQTITVKGGRYLEAQMTGTVDDAEKGTLFILTAGDNSLFKHCESCFCAMGKTTLYLGADAGLASKLNIVQNTLLGTSYAAIAESLALIEPIGLGASDFLDILANGPVNCQDIINKGRGMIEEQLKTNMPMKFIQKFIAFALELGSSVEQPLYLTAATSEVYKHCKCLEDANKDVCVIYNAIKR